MVLCKFRILFGCMSYDDVDFFVTKTSFFLPQNLKGASKPCLKIINHKVSIKTLSRTKPEVCFGINLIKILSRLEVIDQHVPLLDPVLILCISSKSPDKSHHVRSGHNVDIRLCLGRWDRVLMFCGNVEAHLLLDDVTLVCDSVGHPGGHRHCHGDLGARLIGPRNVSEQLHEGFILRLICVDDAS